MSLTCGNFAGKSSYALVVLLTLATVQRAETAGVPRQGLQRHDERQGRRQAHRSKRFAPTVVMFESRDLRDPESYWRAAYALAAAHAAEQGHNFVFYQLPKDTNTLEACDGAPLGPFWGKVAAAVQATFDFPESRFFLLLDSDAAISAAGRPGRRWADRPLAAGLARPRPGPPPRRNDVSAPPRAPGPRRLPVRMQPRVTARIVFHESALYGSAARHTQRRPVTLTQYFTWH